MWSCLKMWFIFNLINFITCEWVEIKQYSNKKTYIVTPHAPYIYGPSMFAPTTSSYETLITPNIYSEQKKSISKLPDAILKNILTTETSNLLTTLKPPKVRNNSTKKSNRKNFKIVKTTSTTTSTYQPTPAINQLYLDEQEYEESLEDYDDDESYVEDVDDGREVAVDDEVDDEEYYDDDEYEDDQPEKQTKKGDSGFTYLSLMPYLQNIQSTLIKNSHTGVNGKVSFLTEIKDRLLFTIKQKIASLWPSGSARRSPRSTRQDSPTWEKSDSDMQFPSNEGALLTLGFLTFAVFLIKSILKLIYSLKGTKGYNNYYPHGNFAIMVVPAASSTTTTMAPAMMMMGKRKRSVNQSEALKILDMIDNYKYMS